MSDFEYKWYILQSYAGYEKRVKQLIEEQLKLKKLKNVIKKIFIPSEEVTTKRGGKETTRQVTYYPGYILLHMRLSDQLWHLLRAIPKVSGFVGGTKKQPLPISDKELDAIRTQIQSGAKQAEIDKSYSIGQNVRVIEGPFADFNGVVDTVDRERSKLTVLVSIFGRATPLELDFDKVAPNE